MIAEKHELAHPRRRDDIDGLRAVAVLFVVAYHAAPGAMPGGFAGVDVFFVISGFIISTILFTNLDRDTFSFAEFYARRVRRIFPGVIIVMLFCLALGWFVLFGDEYAQLSKHAVAGAGFVSNIALWAEAGYFDNAGETKPLLHLWSLGIEEQFYIIWPFLLWAAWKLRFNLAAVALVVGLISFGLNLATIGQDPTGAFYSPLTRFWELICGSLLAWVVLYRPRAIAHFSSVWFSNTLSIAGAGLLLASLMVVRSEGFPGVWAVGPVLGTFLLIAAGSSACINRHVLANPIFVWFGLISFPLYLWHWPLFSFARIIQGDVPSAEIRLAAVAVAILLAWLTVRLLEGRIRAPGHGVAKVVVLVTAMAATGGVGYAIYTSQGLTFRPMAQVGLQATEAKRDWKYESTRFEGGKIVGIHYLTGQTDQSVLFIGSSLMGQYYPRVSLLYSNEPKPLLSTIYASRNHCTPIPNYDLVSAPENINCQQYYAAALDLAREQNVVRVVLAADWPRFFAGEDLTEQGALFVDDIRSLVAAGKQVFLIGRPPMDRRFDPTNIRSNVAEWSILRTEAEDEDSIADTRRVAELAGATLINALDTLCDEQRCPVIRDGRPLYNDGSHVRAEYAASDAKFIDELVAR